MSDLNAENYFGWQTSVQAWLETVESDANRTHLLDPVLLSLCSAAKGSSVLDVGCGNGRFCQLLEKTGLRCVGLDVISGFLEAGKQAGDFTAIQGEGSHLPFVSASFDIVLSYLSLLDIEDFEAAIKEFSRALKPGGKCIVANVHPMVSSIPGWEKDAEGNRLFWRIDRYFESRGEIAEWSGIRVFNWHRTLQEYVATFLNCGFELTQLIEPCPTIENMAARPNLASQARVPNFIVFEWTKK